MAKLLMCKCNELDNGAILVTYVTDVSPDKIVTYGFANWAATFAYLSRMATPTSTGVDLESLIDDADIRPGLTD